MNPYLLLGIGVAWLASVGAAYYKGSEAAENRARAEHATQLERTIAEHNETAAIDMAAALEAGKREAKVRTKVVTLTNEVERIIHAKPAPPDCRVQSDTLKLLVLAAEVANGTDTPASGAVPSGTGKAAPAGKP